MPLQIVRNDITKVECDAIVNAANSTLLGGGGVDGAIHKAAGRGLLTECMKLGGCKVGQAKITKGYNLPCKYVIHTVGPKWKGGRNGEQELLKNCYKNSLILAKENNCESVAFPLISSGVYGYPMNEAFKVAVDTVAEFLMHNDMLVYIVVYNKNAFAASSKLFTDIAQYIDDHYVAEHSPYDSRRINNLGESMPLPQTRFLDIEESVVLSDAFTAMPTLESPKSTEGSLDNFLKETIDESFSEMLLRLIDERGMKDSECYKKANIDKRLFSKIRSNFDYKPSKPTVLAFCIALELPLVQTNEMLMKAGFALSHSNKFDIIVEYFIKQNNYNIFEINEALFAFDQSLLGSVN
ncbi:MAG: O-acetyl-ADP-ribose deacetylase [Clostridiales bacterium]|nr:O-acetyl-ADP-ribose deacetylase [Clostridiales bacterium]